MEEKIKEIFSDVDFLKSLESIQTAEEAQKILEEKGLTLTVEEVQKLGDMINSGEEFDESELDNISGGIATGMLVLYGGIALVSAVAGIKAGWGAGKKSACGRG